MLHSNKLLCYNAGRLVNTVMEHVSILFCLLVYSHTKEWRCYRFKEGEVQMIVKEQEKITDQINVVRLSQREGSLELKVRAADVVV